jgi:hypothetical protein
MPARTPKTNANDAKSIPRSVSSGHAPSHALTRAAHQQWRLWVFFFSALSLILLLATIRTHAHASSVDSSDCTMCSAVLDQVGPAQTPAVSVPPARLLAHRILSVAITVPVHVPARLMPAGRGPPGTPL